MLVLASDYSSIPGTARCSYIHTHVACRTVSMSLDRIDEKSKYTIRSLIADKINESSQTKE